jgi:site-specific recombinase XerD
MTQHLVDLVEQFCTVQRKQRGRTEGGVTTYRWNLEQFLVFLRAREGRLARLSDLRAPMIQAWMDDMAATDLGPNTMRGRLALRVRHLDPTWGLRGVRVKGGQSQDLPLPAVVMEFLQRYVERVLAREGDGVTPDTPLFWSTWGRRTIGKTRAPMTGKNIWRLCKTYGRLIGYPELKPHDLRHGVAVEVLEQRHDLEEVRALLGHTRIDTTQIYTKIRPPQLKRAVAFYEAHAQRMLGA